MSKPIAWDALLARAAAAELDRRLAGARARGLRFEYDARALLFDTTAGTLSWRLHPTEGGLAIVSVRPEANVSLPGDAMLEGVVTPPDERTVVFTIASAGAEWGRLIVELAGNARNAIVVSKEDRVVAALNERRTAARTIAVGETWMPPPLPQREGRDGRIPPERWRALLGQPTDPRARMLETIAWTSPLTVDFLIGDTGPWDSEAARQRWALLVDPAAWRPCLLAGDQPYVHPLEDAQARQAASLIEAIGAVTERSPPAGAEQTRDAALMELDRRRGRALRRGERLRAEAEGAAAEARLLRQHADLLLAQLHRVTRGATEVRLDDWEGGTVTVSLDPALDGARNANALYEAAKKRERAATRLPRMIAKAERDVAELDALIRDVAEDRIDPQTVLPAAPEPTRGRARPGPSLPYRTFRTSGGLEVRVGRGSRANDDLTFHHASPNDVWLHARDVAGAHVVLRWPDATKNPPQRDLIEAAVLAAVHSRARTSGTVPVDWTRRKYVRKPRRSPPGRVAVERTSTLFVEPSESVADRLRVERD